MLASRTTRTTIWPLGCLAVVLIVSSDCGGLEPLPPHFPIPSPVGLSSVAFHCGATAVQPSAVTTPVAFDPDLKNWPEHTGAFAAGQPIAEPSIRAQDVVLHLAAGQRRLLPIRAAGHASSLVPIGGDYWNDTPYPIGTASNAPWVSSAFKAGASLPDRQTDDLVGVMSSAPFALTENYLRMYVGGDSDPGVGVELLVKPLAGKKLSACDAPPVAPQGPKPKLPAGFVVARVRRSSKGPLASDREPLEALEIPLDAAGCDVRGLTGVLRIFDASHSAHINVGTFALADSPLTDAEKDAVPLWGLADYHAHPTDYLSFGGLQGIHTIGERPAGACASTSAIRRWCAGTSRATSPSATTRASRSTVTTAGRPRRS